MATEFTDVISAAEVAETTNSLFEGKAEEEEIPTKIFDKVNFIVLMQNLYQSCIEFQTALVDPNSDDLESLVERLALRLREGRGECIYEVGVAEHSDECGLTRELIEKSVSTLGQIAAGLNAKISLLREKATGGLLTADYLVRQQFDTKDFMEVRVAVVGNVDAGKSTLLGVLTHGELDNGRGFARLKLFRHKHEIESGRTSSVGNDILGFDVIGNVTNQPDPHGGHLDWVKICEDSCKV